MDSSSSSTSPRRKCHQISLDEIKNATDNFSKKNLIGKGGEGDVYMCEIKVDLEMTQVAVKRLSKPEYSEGFEREIKIVSEFQHPNIVSLLGYCDESGEKILLYEYMEKGSLTSYIKKKSSIYLSWQQRLRICLDAARGLRHFHAETEEFPKGIIHRDVKPGNILLDKNWVAKISDFGLLKLSHVGQMQSTMTTGLKGTGRYFAPEYVMNRRITRAADVYAFGVVMFQVLCLTFPWDRGDESYYFMEDEDLGDWAQQNVDSRLKGEICDDSLNAFTAIVGKSLKMDPRKRPTVNGVVLGLENALKFQLLGLENMPNSQLLGLDSALKFQLLEDEAEQHQGAKESIARYLEEIGPEALRLPRQKCCEHISLDEIKRATNNFDTEKLVVQERQVYRAEIRLGEKMTHVAVKCLKPRYYKEFEREIKTVPQIHHPNLVSLLGYCTESGENIVLLEFMEHGSLSSYIEKNSSISLSWQQLLCICLGAARGLQFLHAGTEEFPEGIVHGKVNPNTILLDQNWVAKISGFQLVMLSKISQTHSFPSTLAKRSASYVAPEYWMYGTSTRKTDVYAFGLVLLELLCLPYPGKYSDIHEDAIGIWAQKNVDTRIKEEIGDDSLKAFTTIVVKSLKKDPRNRPTMDEVVFDLENVLKWQERHEDEAMQPRAEIDSDKQSTGVLSEGSQSQDKRGSSSRRSTKFINSIRNWWRHK